MRFFPHQYEVLNATKQYNRVTIKGFEGLYEVDTWTVMERR